MVSARHYVPEAGDIVRLSFDPQAGREQAGRRPALVLSPASYNGKTGLMLCCPLTTRVPLVRPAPPPIQAPHLIRQDDTRACSRNAHLETDSS